MKKELGNAYKETHWMWFIFPQIQGLGFTAKSNYYAIESIEEAKAYMKNLVLGTRLIECWGALCYFKCPAKQSG